MLRFAFVNIFLLCNSVVNSQLRENFSSNWVPLNYTEKPTENNSVTQTTENLWKQAQPSQDLDVIKEDAIQIVNPPVQTHRRKGISFYFSTPNINEAIDFSGFDYVNNPENIESTETLLFEKTSESPENIKFNASDVLKTTELPEAMVGKSSTSEDIELSELSTKVKFNKSDFIQPYVPRKLKLNTSDFVQSYVPRKVKFNTRENIKFNASDVLTSTELPEPSIGKSNTSEYIELSELSTKLNFNKSDFIKSYVPRKITFNTSESSKRSEFPKYEKFNASKVTEPSELSTNVKLNTSEVLLGSVPETLQRKSKQIQNHYFVNFIDNLGENITKDETEAAETSTYLVSLNKKKYEVTEAATTTEARDDSTKLNKGYIYKQPLVIPLGLTPVRNPITNKLLDNLSKNNIKVNDILNNYSASKIRLYNHDNMFKNIFHPQIPSLISIPFRYNSLNHLPVNPLLGAFLSNYGYYLKGSFGRPNDYKNLYGYSASNNIHNNKPFGSYKHFADTDANH